jgi:hypothetical protein
VLARMVGLRDELREVLDSGGVYTSDLSFDLANMHRDASGHVLVPVVAGDLPVGASAQSAYQALNVAQASKSGVRSLGLGNLNQLNRVIRSVNMQLTGAGSAIRLFVKPVLDPPPPGELALKTLGHPNITLFNGFEVRECGAGRDLGSDPDSEMTTVGYANIYGLVDEKGSQAGKFVGICMRTWGNDRGTYIHEIMHGLVGRFHPHDVRAYNENLMASGEYGCKATALSYSHLTCRLSPCRPDFAGFFTEPLTPFVPLYQFCFNPSEAAQSYPNQMGPVDLYEILKRYGDNPNYGLGDRRQLAEGPDEASQDTISFFNGAPFTDGFSDAFVGFAIFTAVKKSLMATGYRFISNNFVSTQITNVLTNLYLAESLPTMPSVMTQSGFLGETGKEVGNLVSLALYGFMKSRTVSQGLCRVAGYLVGGSLGPWLAGMTVDSLATVITSRDTFIAYQREYRRAQNPVHYALGLDSAIVRADLYVADSIRSFKTSLYMMPVRLFTWWRANNSKVKMGADDDLLKPLLSRGDRRRLKDPVCFSAV